MSLQEGRLVERDGIWWILTVYCVCCRTLNVERMNIGMLRMLASRTTRKKFMSTRMTSGKLENVE